MPFDKNDPNINREGRPKGSKNKRTIWIEALKEAIPDDETLESGIAKELYQIAMDPQTSVQDKLKALSLINQVVFNKPSESFEIDTNLGNLNLKELFKFTDNNTNNDEK